MRERASPIPALREKGKLWTIPVGSGAILKGPCALANESRKVQRDGLIRCRKNGFAPNEVERGT